MTRGRAQRSARTAISLIIQHLPPFDRHEWGALALLAAERAGLEHEDLASLRRHLMEQRLIDERG